jgi:WD40-like Beta Propeller Repeat
MTARDDFDRQLVAWLKTDAPTSAPEQLLGEVLARTARTRRRPAWRVPERWISMSTITSRVAVPPGVPWRTIAVAAILVLALVASAVLFAGSQRRQLPPPFGLAANGALVYSSGGDLMIADTPTSAPHALLGGDAGGNGPIISPDGTRLVFVKGAIGGPDAELWTALIDGSGARKLAAAPGIGWAEWSPQSDTVAVLLDGAPSTIRLIDVSDGSGQDLNTGLASIQNVVWRPSNGDDLTLRAQDTNGQWGIYLIGREGDGLRRLDLDPGFASDAYYQTNADYYFQGPTWSADGARLLYYTLEPSPGSPSGPGFRNHVATVDAAGQVTSDRVIEFNGAIDDEFAGAWLGGDSILYQIKEGSQNALRIGSVAADHGPARDLGVTANDYWIPFTVSPDARAALVSLPSGDIRVIDLATGDSTPSTLAAAEDIAWQRLATP